MPGMMGLVGTRTWAAAVLAALVVAAAVTDVRARRVPNWLTYPAIVLALAGHALDGGLRGNGPVPGLVEALAGFAVGFFPLLLCWLAGGIGGGDAKLMGAVGALGGWRFVIGAMLYGFVVAAAMGIVVMVRQRIARRTLRRVWHTLALLIIPGAKPADPTGPDSPKIPFALALCIGTVAALVAQVLWNRPGP